MSVMGQVECAGCGKPYEEGARFCPYCGTAAAAAAPLPSDPFIGATVNGKFRVEAMIGQGGMGRVYRARHLTLDRPVVLKMLHRAYSSDPQIVQRFQREARAASRLNHPNSIAVLDFGETEDGTLFMAMEYLAGRDLGRVVADDFPLGEARIVRIGAQVLSALAEAHVQGIIHRDLKPENVMLVPRRDDPDHVKVLDFGIAKIVSAGDSEPRLTQAGLVCGTPEYMSPEQARGADLDARSDLYSMGVLLYQLCTGALPFQSDTPVGFLTAHLSQIPVPPRQRRPDLAISPALDALVSRALEKDPARRFASADEMRAALVGCAPASGSRPGAATPRQASSAPAGAVTRRTSRRPLWIAAAVLAIALLGGGAALAGMLRGDHLRPGPGAGTTTTTAAAGTTAPSTAAATPALDPGSSTTPPATAQPDPVAAATPSAGSGSPASPAPDAAAPAPDPRSPALAASLFKKAESRRAQQNVDAAIPLYLAALEADPSLAEAHKKLALCYQLKGDRRRAAERYRKYLATNPKDAERVRMILSTLE